MANEMQVIRNKVLAGERLTGAEGEFLYAYPDLFEIGELANLVRERKHGNKCYYNVNVHLNPTNVCVYRCNFCAYRSDLKGPNGYVMSDAEIVARAQEARDRRVTEMHIVGGLHHLKDFEWYKHILKLVHDTCPNIHLKGYTAVEIDWFSRISGRPTREVLEELIEAGLGSLPGGGAEIFHPDVRDQICEHKADSESWIRIHREAHQLGLRSNATMLYGHLENAHHRIDHMLKLRALQDETGGFQTFIPLAFHPANTKLEHIRKPSGLMDLRTMAIARLMLDNFPHIKAYWIMLGIGIAQTALWFGADDIDGTVVHELIYHKAGAETPEILTVAQLERFDPRDRPSADRTRYLYHEIRRTEAGWTRGERVAVGV